MKNVRKTIYLQLIIYMKLLYVLLYIKISLFLIAIVSCF
jgi:hypothetical protein